MELKTQPLEMRMTGKDGKIEFYLYINGNEKVIKHTIKYLQEYLKLIKLNLKKDVSK